MFGAPPFSSTCNTYIEALFTYIAIISANMAYLNFSPNSTVSEDAGNEPVIAAEFLLKVRATVTTIGLFNIHLATFKADQARDFRLRVFLHYQKLPIWEGTGKNRFFNF